MKKGVDISLKELFMAKAGKNGWDNTFMGVIERRTDTDGNPVVHGKVKIGTGYIVASAKDQWELGEKLDELVLANLCLNLCDDPKPELN